MKRLIIMCISLIFLASCGSETKKLNPTHISYFEKKYKNPQIDKNGLRILCEESEAYNFSVQTNNYKVAVYIDLKTFNGEIYYQDSATDRFDVAVNILLTDSYILDEENNQQIPLEMLLYYSGIVDEVEEYTFSQSDAMTVGSDYYVSAVRAKIITENYFDFLYQEFISEYGSDEMKEEFKVIKDKQKEADVIEFSYENDNVANLFTTRMYKTHEKIMNYFITESCY